MVSIYLGTVSSHFHISFSLLYFTISNITNLSIILLTTRLLFYNTFHTSLVYNSTPQYHSLQYTFNHAYSSTTQYLTTLQVYTFPNTLHVYDFYTSLHKIIFFNIHSSIAITILSKIFPLYNILYSQIL